MSADARWETCNKGVSEKFPFVSTDVIKKLRHRKHMLLSTDDWRKRRKVIRLRCVGSNGNRSKHHDFSRQARVSRNDSEIETKVSATKN